MTHNNMDLTAPRLEDSYIANYQTYMKQKSGYESLLNGSSTPSTETKLAKDNYKNNECKICSVIGKSSDLPRVLNQGLYYKYTSSQDFFYTKDITCIIEKKRQPSSIKYYDDIVYDEEKEHLKAMFKVEESQTLMNEIKQFYSQFYIFARNFQKPYFRILNTNIARHRRIEYIRVFQNNSPRETTHTKYGNTDENQFNFMQMLGETFLRDNYKETSTFGERLSERRSGFRKETEQYLNEVETNFKKLRNLDRQSNYEGDGSNKLSNAMYNKQYMLYSRNDSETAEEVLRNVLYEFKIGEKKVQANQKEASVTKIEARKKTPIREKKKVVSRSRPQSPSGGNVSITKFQSERANILKEIMRDADNGRSEIEYLTERINAKDLKPPREHQGEEVSHRLTRPESMTNLHRNGIRREPKGTNLIAKFNPGNLKDAVYDRESILNQVSQMRSSQNKQGDYKLEEKKNHTPIETHYKPSPVYEDGSSTATSKQAKASYVNSPTGFKSHSSLETLIQKKYEEKPSKSPLIRPEVIIPNTSRETKIVLKRGDSLVGFDSTKSNKSKDSRTGADSTTSRKTLKTSKSNPRSLNRDRETPFENLAPVDIVNLKRGFDNSGAYLSARKPYFEQDIPELVQKIVPQQKNVRSVSSGIKKLRFEAAPDWKREESLRRGNISISTGYQNVSASYRSVGPLVEAQNQARIREDLRNYECQRIAEIYSHAGHVRKRSKAKSTANILIHPSSVPKTDLIGKEAKRGSSPEIEIGIQERKKITFRDVKDLINVWSPKLSKKLPNKEKSPIKLQANKVSKHQRYASRG